MHVLRPRTRAAAGPPELGAGDVLELGASHELPELGESRPEAPELAAGGADVPAAYAACVPEPGELPEPGESCPEVPAAVAVAATDALNSEPSVPPSKMVMIRLGIMS